MPRPVTKTDMLSQDYISLIHRLYNGNVSKFYEKYLSKSISQADYYNALRLFPTNPDTINKIEFSITEALLEHELDEETIFTLPDLETLVHLAFIRLRTLRESSSEATLKDVQELEKYFKFYSKVMQRKRIQLVQTKKTVLNHKLYYHHWSKYLPFDLLDHAYLKEQEEELSRIQFEAQ